VTVEFAMDLDAQIMSISLPVFSQSTRLPFLSKTKARNRGDEDLIGLCRVATVWRSLSARPYRIWPLDNINGSPKS